MGMDMIENRIYVSSIIEDFDCVNEFKFFFSYFIVCFQILNCICFAISAINFVLNWIIFRTMTSQARCWGSNNHFFHLGQVSLAQLRFLKPLTEKRFINGLMSCPVQWHGKRLFWNFRTFFSEFLQITEIQSLWKMTSFTFNIRLS